MSCGCSDPVLYSLKIKLTHSFVQRHIQRVSLICFVLSLFSHQFHSLKFVSNRTYQSEVFHHKTQCIPWTEKPPQSHYIVHRSGTPTSDVVWKCEDGYVERQYTVSGYECVKMTTMQQTSLTTTTKTVPTSQNSMRGSATTPLASQHQDKNNHNVIIIVCIILGFVIFVVCIVVYMCWRHHVLCFHKARRERREENNRESGGNEDARPLTEDDEHCENFHYFSDIVDNLPPDKAKIFICYLRDPSKEFKPDVVIELERSKNSDPRVYFTKACVRWASLNNGINKEHIQEGLTKVGYPDLLEEIEEMKRIQLNSMKEGGTKSATEDVPDSAHGHESKAQLRTKKAPDRYMLYLYLIEKLGVDSCVTLLHQLPETGNGFNAMNMFTQKRGAEGVDVKSAFGDTLVDWFRANPSVSLSDVIQDCLEHLERHDILEDEKFKHLMQNIADTTV